MAAILQKAFSNPIFCIKIVVFQILLKFIPNGSTNDKPALGQVMTWHRTGDKPLSEPMMA